MTFHLVFYLGIVFSRNIHLTTAFMFFLGMTSVARASVGYLYALEFVPHAKQAAIGTGIQIVNTLVTILSCIYFYFISK